MEVAVGHDAVSWLSEDAGRRLQKLSATANAELRASEDGAKVVVKLLEGASGGIAWAEFCVRALCASRTGAAVDAQPPKGSESWSPQLSVVEVPREECKPFVSGKAGGRLLQLSDDLDVVAVFGQEAGSLIEAKYEGGNRWFEAEVVKAGKSTVKVKWTYDENVPESEVPLEDCRPHPQDAKKSKASPLEVGALVEAKFGNKDRWFEAIILKVNDKTVKVKWTYDEDVPPSEVAKSDVKTKPKVDCDPLYVLGNLRGRLELELKVLTLIETKVPGFVSARPRTSDEGEGVGLSVWPLLNDGELKAKVIGKSGSVRNKIGKSCDTSVEYIGNSAYVVGNQLSRVRTAKLLELVQRSSSGAVDHVPSELEVVCTRVAMPTEASYVVTGKQRSSLNQLEEETGTMTFWGPDVAPSPAKAEAGLQLEKGKFVQGRFKNKWFEATILEVTTDEHGEKSVKVRWDYDESETSVLPASDIREVDDGAKAQEPKASDSRVLVIIGSERSRKFAEFRAMATVEMKCPGNYKDLAPPAAGDAFGHEVLRLGSQELQRCSEKRLRAVATVAQCLLEQVGEVLHLAGTGAERAQAREYVEWLTAATVPQAAGRKDVDELVVPKDKRGSLADHAVASLEQDTETLIFFEGGGTATSSGDAKLLVVGRDSTKRARALLKLRELQERSRPPFDDDDDDSWGVKAAPKVVYVVSKDEEERRRKRAARFATPPK